MMQQRGFALPITIFLIAILTLMLGSTFTRAATENQIAHGSKAAIVATFVAQSGLEKYFSQDFLDWNRPVPGDSMRLDLQGGWAWVVPEVLRTPADTMNDFLYIIRSTGYVENPSQPGDVLANRAIAQFAHWQTPWIDAPPAALIAANGLEIDGPVNKVVFDGRDRPNSLCAGDPLLPDGIGARLPASGNSGLWRADPYGAPALLKSGTRASVAQLVNIDWAAIRSGEFIPDYTSPQNGLTGDFPSQLVAGNYSESNDHFEGEGLLIVTGDLRISTSREHWSWRGVILVGGQANFESDTTYIYGRVITGLNYLTGDSPTNNDTDVEATQLARIRFDSCNIRKSLKSLKGFVPLVNTWVDNWSTF